MNWKLGLYTAAQIPEGIYHADQLGDQPTLSRGGAVRILNESLYALKYFHPRLDGNKEEISEEKQKNMDMGNVRHSMLLGSGQAFETVRGFDDWKTKEARGKRDACREAGKIPLLTKDYEKQLSIVEQVLPRIVERVGPIPAESSEMTALWEEVSPLQGFSLPGDPPPSPPRTVRCRTRIDTVNLAFPGVEIEGTEGVITLRPGAWVFDFKGAKDVSPRWERGVDAIGLDLQAWIHVHALEVLLPELAGRINFADVVFQTVAPYDVAVIPWPKAALELGLLRWNRAVHRWAGALSSGRWPGVGGRDMEVFDWQLKREAAYEFAEEEA